VYHYDGQEINRSTVRVLFSLVGREKEKVMLPAILLTPDHKGRRLLYMIGRHINTLLLSLSSTISFLILLLILIENSEHEMKNK
jgi:hypothetical protein